MIDTFDKTFQESAAKQIAAWSKAKYGNVWGELELSYVEDAIHRAFKSAMHRKKTKTGG